MLSDSQPRTPRSNPHPSSFQTWTNCCGILIALLTLILPIAIVTQQAPPAVQLLRPVPEVNAITPP
ncbi:MAG: hypothetical protein VKJ24_09915 [Synechococcales bacterium]|nr:hypothetical protein [Synechococcales bacterium]